MSKNLSIKFQTNSVVKGVFIAGKKVSSESSLGSFVIDTEITQGIIKVTFEGNILGGPSHYPLYGLVHKSRMLYVQNINIHDSSAACSLNHDSICTGLRYVHKVTGKPDLFFYPQTGTHIVSIEVNMNTHTVHFFVNGNLIPHCIVNVPTSVFFAFTLYNTSVEVKSLCDLTTPTAHSSLACFKYPWMGSENCQIVFQPNHPNCKAVINGSKISTTENVVRNFVVDVEMKWGVFKVTFQGSNEAESTQYPLYGFVDKSEVATVHTANIHNLVGSCFIRCDSICTGLDYPFNVSGKAELYLFPTSGEHTIALEVDFSARTVHFFVNDKQIPHCITNVPESLYPVFTLYQGTAEVKSVRCLVYPTIDPALKCKEYPWFEVEEDD